MKSLFTLLLTLLLTSASYSQTDLTDNYDVSEKYPFGKLNPDVNSKIGDWAPLIGQHTCDSDSRAPDGSWNPTGQMIWTWKYIMNGTAVQDETLNSSGIHSGSIRQFNADSSKWYVHYYSSAPAPSTLPSWEGNLLENGEIILYNPQKAPNGMDGFYKIRFYEINDAGFKWAGAWVSPDESIVYPTWNISCTKDS